MNHILLSKLSWTDKSPVLKLRLLHSWTAGNPARPGGFTERATLWTDELGVLVQGLAPNQISAQLDEVLAVRTVYFVTKFFQGKSRKRWAACSNERVLSFTSNTSFVPSTEDNSTFCPDSFEFRQLEDLHAITSLNEALVDVVGRLVSATPVGYV
ncbi:unnamed protein product [Linum trigynum]|uniref:Uncharacterized protein n=1 Tax=Linum trigynum TaxID=586398 RepID=A0AAV2CM82_9ROSI